MSKNKFKFIDILVFCFIAFVFELVNSAASTHMGKYVIVFLSYTIVLTLIEIYRWGIVGGVVGLCGALGACLASGKYIPSVFAIYCGGNLSLFLMWFYVYFVKHERVKKNIGFLFIYLALGYLLTCLTRSSIATLFGYNFISIFKDYFVTESISFCISFAILLIARTKNGLLTEMNAYLLEEYEERTNPMRELRRLKEDPYYNPTAEVIDGDQFNDANILEGGTLSQEDLQILQKTYDEKENENL